MAPFGSILRHPVFCVVAAICMVPVTAGSSVCSSCTGNNVTCADGICLPRCVNVTSSGECLMCRDFMFHGVQCETLCPHTCLNARCQMNNSHVVCKEGCVAGKKGDNCGVDCPPSCTHCVGDECIGPCLNPRYFGPKCKTPCPEDCNSGCDKNTGKCKPCSVGYMGEHCTTVCPSGCKDGCHQETGACNSCMPWYGGDYCDVCQTGYRGKYCNINCPALCTACERHGNKCIGACLNIWNYGQYCNLSCPSNCRERCQKLTGECDGCVPGFRGTYCNVTCPVNCTECTRLADECVEPCTDSKSYGASCQHHCPVNCKDGCYRLTGDCINCNPGYRGRYCKLPCSNGACNPGDPRLTTKVVGGAVAVVVLLGLSIAGSVLMKRYRSHHSRVPAAACRAETTRRCNCGDYWTHKYWEINEQDVNSDQCLEEVARPTSRYPHTLARTTRAESRPEKPEHERRGSNKIEEQNANSISVPGTLNIETFQGSNTGAGLTMTASYCEARPTVIHDDDDDDGLYPIDEKVSFLNTEGDPILASAKSENGIDYCHMSLDTQRLIKKTDSVLFIEQNCDMSKVNVKYLTPKSKLKT
ncbi:multiple epidermal growth factor-like domains protein 10 isoform X1 [Haliotis rufescens]|uniref:multiple epidermal growth factor-like domains protein 10 isoform X1 n=1 Tax=Haliotis rufescens TaxID=6454 RepID=UPI00201ED792|nr:multiple epidermal growth factor-like domains protein 10 isoform X1 [Haliotis rufescens]